ncbi:hypothetical protein [Actinomadura sp. 7K507]|uniref:hypothetical protein n=1 Tax=Actinomadura sp. 7K507 TaxID=2530365 RepID=UPI0010506774|nr:hypothetical protein [Actinomadura sp. 7K507]TDC72827.1 hypothetical protein E1285_45015 [Actinomadura sp. 7K507]
MAVLAGTTRGIATLLQATAVSERWGTTAYGALSGILAAPVTIAAATAPFASILGGYPCLVHRPHRPHRHRGTNRPPGRRQRPHPG